MAGFATGLALLVVGFGFRDAAEVLLNVQFELIQREDVAVAFREPVSPATVHALARKGALPMSEVARAIKELDVNPEKSFPVLAV